MSDTRVVDIGDIRTVMAVDDKHLTEWLPIDHLHQIPHHAGIVELGGFKTGGAHNVVRATCVERGLA